MYIHFEIQIYQHTYVATNMHSYFFFFSPLISTMCQRFADNWYEMSKVGAYAYISAHNIQSRVRVSLLYEWWMCHQRVPTECPDVTYTKRRWVIFTWKTPARAIDTHKHTDTFTRLVVLFIFSVYFILDKSAMLIYIPPFSLFTCFRLYFFFISVINIYLYPKSLNLIVESLFRHVILSSS